MSNSVRFVKFAQHAGELCKFRSSCWVEMCAATDGGAGFRATASEEPETKKTEDIDQRVDRLIQEADKQLERLFTS